jgi:hypothetical protein
MSTAQPQKTVGAAASAAARRENGRKRKEAEPPAFNAIAGASNTELAPFPSDVCEVDLEMPVRDERLIGRQIPHAADLGKGSGLEFFQWHHSDDKGAPRPGAWKFKLVSSLKSTELKKVPLCSSV